MSQDTLSQRLVPKEFRGKPYHCPAELTLLLVGGKWKTTILWYLNAHGPLRFNQLLERMEPVASKVLSQKLKELEEDGLVSRQAEPGRVEYAATGLAKKLIPALEALEKWGEAYEAEVLGGRENSGA